MITLKDIQAFRKDKKLSFDHSISTVCEIFDHAPETRSSPIYSIEKRVKSAESAYLKAKNKGKKAVAEITDFAGVRIVCRCEQDLIETHFNLLERIPNHIQLTEFTLFNWPEQLGQEHDRQMLTKAVSDRDPRCNCRELRSRAGYKSIHYLLRLSDDQIVELQLRTLIQNVWSELEHKLAYKAGARNAQIKLNFENIARHLEAIESVISNVKEISDRELISSKEYRQQQGPIVIFHHEDPALDEAYKGPQFDEYELHLQSSRRGLSNNELEAWKSKGRDLFDCLSDQIKNQHRSSQYWKSSEEAYWLFAEGNYDKAAEKYHALLKNDDFTEQHVPKLNDRRYLIHFRLGEIYHIKGKYTLSFEQFDECEILMHDSSDSERDNMYKVAVLLGYFYWRYNAEFSHISLRYMQQAEKWARDGDYIQKSNFLNSQLYYLLETYWRSLAAPRAAMTEETGEPDVAPKQDDFLAKMVGKYNELVKFLKELPPENLNSNIFHTLACVAAELDESERTRTDQYDGSYLSQAVEHCKQCMNLANGNDAYSRDLSLSIQREAIDNIFLTNWRRQKSQSQRA